MEEACLSGVTRLRHENNGSRGAKRREACAWSGWGIAQQIMSRQLLSRFLSITPRQRRPSEAGDRRMEAPLRYIKRGV